MWDPHCDLNVDPDWDSWIWWPKIVKFTGEKFNLLWIKNGNVFILRPPWRTSKLKKKHPALQNNIFLNFSFICGSSLLVPDPNTIGLNQIGSGIPDPTNLLQDTRKAFSMFFFYCMPLGKDLVYADLYKTKQQYILFCSVKLEIEQ
jgi:hypothetical protein